MKSKSRIKIFLFLLVLMFVWAVAVGAKASDERRLTREIVLLDRAASSPQGEQAVTAMLVRNFKITAEQVKSLRARDLPFGDIVALYAMADRMEGGVSPANVSRVVDLRQGSAGWVQIARVYDVDLGSVSREVDRIGKEVRSRIGKQAERAGSLS